ncbi:EMI domain-containing protein 1 isoform X2 [Dermochelys coriacea]|nr:EMI domain-containing protein 1 isoform X2 [Dermochelys coriacea]
MVTRTVSCHVQNGTFLQRVFQGCRWPGGCNGGSYRAIVRPAYKVAYKTVTALEWKCCPGHTGVNCKEETISYIAPQETGHPAPLRRLPLQPATYSGCLNCSKVVELTARLNSLEAKVALLSAAEPATSLVPNRHLVTKGAVPSDSYQLWGSPSNHGNPGDEGVKGNPGEKLRGAIPGQDGNQGPKDSQGPSGPKEILGARGQQESLEPRVPLDCQAPRVRQGGMVQGASPERRDFRAFQGPQDPQDPLPQWGLQYPTLLTQGTRFCQTPSLNLTALAPWGLRDPQDLQGQWVLWAPQGQLGYQALRGAMGYPECQVLTEPPVPQGRKETEGSWVQKASRGRRVPGPLAYNPSYSSRPSWSSWLEGSPCWKPSSGQNQSQVQVPNPSPLAPPASTRASVTGWQPTESSHTNWPRRPRMKASEEGAAHPSGCERKSCPQALRPPWARSLPSPTSFWTVA